MKYTLALLFAASTVLMACKKEAGEGGRAEIRGTVLRKNVGSMDSAAYADQRVYIIYGDDDFHSDDVRTDGNGLYVFRWLRKGKYRIYTFGECVSAQPGCANGMIQLERAVEIGSRKEVVTVPTITCLNY